MSESQTGCIRSPGLRVTVTWLPQIPDCPPGQEQVMTDRPGEDRRGGDRRTELHGLGAGGQRAPGATLHRTASRKASAGARAPTGRPLCQARTTRPRGEPVNSPFISEQRRPLQVHSHASPPRCVPGPPLGASRTGVHKSQARHLARPRGASLTGVPLLSASLPPHTLPF